MKNNKGIASILIVLIIVGILVLGGGVYYFLTNEPQKSVVCTQKAKLCSDGSYVSRTGPRCEFAACPETNLNCKDSSKYFVISKDSNDNLGTDFLIKYKISKDQIIPCDYVVEKTDFELKNQAATFFLALTDNFLVLDTGTAPPPRILTVYDLNGRKKVYTDSYSDFLNTSSDVITYWNPIKEKITNENCPKLNEYLADGLGAEIEASISLDLSTLVKKELGQYRCSPTQ